jgi:acyl-CoA dehydrogenase
MAGFVQDAPQLGNQFNDDLLLREYLERKLPSDMRAATEPAMAELGALAGGELYHLFLSDPTATPKHVPYTPWGARADSLELTALWKRAQTLAASYGVVATAYDKSLGAHARTVQFALAYLFDGSTAVYTCPLAMTDGAARALLESGNDELIKRAVPRLTSRDPEHMWTSGQWMTERVGGSDVSQTETRATARDDGSYSLYGTKWFTSATSSQMALTLARPAGGATGNAGLALFYVETRDGAGPAHGLSINRLKDKLGTRMVPTAELTLDGVRALPVSGLNAGVKSITPMLGTTRIWNAVCACAGMRRAVALTKSYADKRHVHGGKLNKLPLQCEVLATLTAESMGAFLLTFRAVELLGKQEHNLATDSERELLRLLTPVIKLTTGKQAVAVASEATEAFGGAGYIEDTGIPKLLRDAQVLPIWEGTTNVLSLDHLRALGRNPSLDPYAHEVSRLLEPALHLWQKECDGIFAALSAAATMFARSINAWRAEGSARAVSLATGRILQAAYLVDHALWEHQTGKPLLALAAAKHMIQRGLLVDLFIADEADLATLSAGS